MGILCYAFCSYKVGWFHGRVVSWSGGFMVGWFQGRVVSWSGGFMVGWWWWIPLGIGIVSNRGDLKMLMFFGPDGRAALMDANSLLCWKHGRWLLWVRLHSFGLWLGSVMVVPCLLYHVCAV